MSFDSTEMPGEMPDPMQQTQNMLDLTGLLFKQYCDEREIPLNQAAETNPINFLAWVKENLSIWNVEQINEVCSEANVPTDAFDRLMALADEPTGANQLAGVWPQITLDFRGKPRNRLESIHTVCLLKWDDGRVAPLSSFVPAELSSVQGEFTDGSVATLMQVGANNLMQMLMQFSLDHLHDHKSSEADDHAYEVVMGLLIKILQGAVIIDPQSGQQVRVSDEMIPRCQEVMRVLQSMFRPPIAPHIQAKIQQLRQQRRQEEVIQSGEPPQGGWDG